VTGAPGVGKSSLGYRIARELGLGRVLRWAITSRSTLRLGLYDYDAIGRAQNAGLRARWHQQAGEPVSMDVNESERAAAADIGDYLQLGPLGTALLPYSIPRVLLIDELDKSDIDLPNDLLHVFEEGEYTVRELDRVRALMPVVEVHTDDPGRTAKITEGRVRCRAFPIIVITSNREREFPPAFLRRCLRLEVQPPGREQLASMVAAQFSGDRAGQDTAWLIRDFLERRSRRRGMGADQLLNAVHLATSDAYTADRSWDELLDLVWRHLDETPPA
jgi:MoxR-like ATPase